MILARHDEREDNGSLKDKEIDTTVGSDNTDGYGFIAINNSYVVEL